MKKIIFFLITFLFFSIKAFSQCIPPTTPVAFYNGPVCTGKPLILLGANYDSATYKWNGPNGFTSTLQDPLVTLNANFSDSGIYSVTVTQFGCTSAPGFIKVVIKPTPANPSASNNSPVCSGQTLSLSASNIAGATYTWIGQNGFTSALQNPDINNSKLTDAGIYQVVATVDGCASSAVATNVTIKQTPAIPITGSNSPLCTSATLNLSANDITGAVYNWSGPNGFTSSAQNPVINNITLTQSGIYNVVATVNGCPSIPGPTNVVVQPLVPSGGMGTTTSLCAGTTLNLTAASMTGVTYSWTGPNGFTSSVQNPVINNIGLANAGIYTSTITGCNSASTTTTIIVNPAPAAPTANNNGPLCIGQTLNLTAGLIAGASYTWTGPNGFTSSLQNPVINNTMVKDSGTYKVIATVNGCPGPEGLTDAVVLDSARADAGKDQSVCAHNSDVKLAGVITGGSGSGIWNASGTGTFSPNNISLNAVYNLTSADKSSGNVLLTLTSTNNGACPASASSFTVTIPGAIKVDAGADLGICASNNDVVLNGQVISASGGIWSTSGTGMFSNNMALSTKYIPSAGDKLKGSITITLTSTGNGSCSAASDDAILTINPGPQVNAGPDRAVEENKTIILSPVVSGTNLKYNWLPGFYLNNDTIKNPVVTGISDQVYTLKVIDGNGCINEDQVAVIVLKSPGIPNTFTPNNDGINDTWNINNLEKYPDSRVQVFNRYGQIVFESKGYPKPWDGTRNGKSLPFGTYYYIIEPGNGVTPFTGYITLIK